MAQKTYYVDPTRNLRHGVIGKDGVNVETDYAGGEAIKMDEAEAAPLLELGVLLKDKPEQVVKKELAQVEKELEEANATIENLAKENGKLKTDFEAALKQIEALKPKV